MKNSYDEILKRMLRAGEIKNSAHLARALNVTPQALSNYKKKGSMPFSLIVKFSKLFNVSIDWLIFNKGDELSGGAAPAPELNTLEQGGGPTIPVLTAEEAIYTGKLLKILRVGDDKLKSTAQCSIDIFFNEL